MADTQTTKLGPWGCYCMSFYHHMAGDGCELCNPELARFYEEESKNELQEPTT